MSFFDVFYGTYSSLKQEIVSYVGTTTCETIYITFKLQIFTYLVSETIENYVFFGFDPQQDSTSDGLVAEDERGAYFSDGLRKIDLVLAYDADDTQSSLKRDGDVNDEGGEAEQHRRQHRKAWRDTFEANLIYAGETQIDQQDQAL